MSSNRPLRNRHAWRKCRFWGLTRNSSASKPCYSATPTLTLPLASKRTPLPSPISLSRSLSRPSSQKTKVQAATVVIDTSPFKGLPKHNLWIFLDCKLIPNNKIQTLNGNEDGKKLENTLEAHSSMKFQTFLPFFFSQCQRFLAVFFLI